MRNTITSQQQPLTAIAHLTTTTTGANQRRTWSAATALKNTMDIGGSYPGYERCRYWPSFSENETKFYLTSYNRDANGDLHAFNGRGDTLEVALVKLNEDLKAFFIKGISRPTQSQELEAFEQVITDAFLSQNETSDLVTVKVA